jgi:hypothetical protein
MATESLSAWLLRVGSLAAQCNKESRRENERDEAHRIKQIADALAIVTHDLSSAAHREGVRLAQTLANRVWCEAWGRDMGWTIPEYGTPAWQELHAAWLDSND